ncbi:chemotaxis-specific protein-glutamate methyltransferase CheB [Piscirickettsia litoralis]|uniref:chemotaxis-specific protein-glutamate methyltransferase CheB n=1 Tax=Piscirickettsia litoralis TaxID=1891921 RepID=UPI001F366ABB|nr:chemotaxis-specific protein-glutamate methyltransferase CheB [Piscirickettsia litoralis]
MKKYQPDVVTLDTDMPKMDGLSFLENLMRAAPLPVVMIASQTKQQANEAVRALSLGAVDFIYKPENNFVSEFKKIAPVIIRRVKSAAESNVIYEPLLAEHRKAVGLKLTSEQQQKKLIAIGASTGGTETIRSLLKDLPDNLPAIVIAQHMPASFTAAFAESLSQDLSFPVHEAVDLMTLEPGHIYIAPGGRHLKIKRRGKQYQCQLYTEIEGVTFKPSVDVLFGSVARACGRDAVGIILTGMGSDGAEGLKLMKEQGGFTVAQDQESSVVWGMAGSAVKLGAAVRIAGLREIAGEVVEYLMSNKASL